MQQEHIPVPPAATVSVVSASLRKADSGFVSFASWLVTVVFNVANGSSNVFQ